MLINFNLSCKIYSIYLNYMYSSNTEINDLAGLLLFYVPYVAQTANVNCCCESQQQQTHLKVKSEVRERERDGKN